MGEEGEAEKRRTESKVPHLVPLLDGIPDLHLVDDRPDHHRSDAHAEDGPEGGGGNLDDRADVLAVDVWRAGRGTWERE